MCVVKGCNHNSKSHKAICGFYRIPRVKENENEETKKLQGDEDGNGYRIFIDGI